MPQTNLLVGEPRGLGGYKTTHPLNPRFLRLFASYLIHHLLSKTKRGRLGSVVVLSLASPVPAGQRPEAHKITSGLSAIGVSRETHP